MLIWIFFPLKQYANSCLFLVHFVGGESRGLDRLCCGRFLLSYFIELSVFNLGYSCGDFLLLTASCRKSRVFCTLQNAELVKLKSLGYFCYAR